MKYFIQLTGLFMLMVGSSACVKKQISPPEVLLTDSVLINLLTDSYILNAAFNQTAGSVKDSVGQAYSRQILDKYQITQEVLDQNINWLYAHPQKLDSIFDLMMDRMDYLENRISENVSPPSG
jgi:hypothetical protein